jgi:stage V sporulation protein B
MTLILRRLQHLGMGSDAANALYGIYTTVTVPIFNLIPALLTSVALPLIPTLSAQIEAKDMQGQGETVNTAIRLTALLSIPASLALALYSKPIISLLFGISGAELGTSASLLTALSVSVAFSGMITTTNAILQAYGQAKLPIISMLIGSAIKLLSAAILIGIPSVNIYGAPLSTLLCNSVIVGINLHMIVKHSGIMKSLRQVLLQPLLAATPSVGIPALLFAVLSSHGWNERILFVAMVPLTLVIMAVLSLKSGILGERELEGIANGRIYRLLQRRLRFLLPKKL